MDTTRLNISYRPLRICWAINEGDFDALRLVVRKNSALWGGRFNPVVAVQRLQEAQLIVEKFRPDVILSIGEGDEIQKFINDYQHLKSPFHSSEIFSGDEESAFTQVLDIDNLILHHGNTAEWKILNEPGAALYRWAEEDPLADALLMQLGAFPNDKRHIDYESVYKSGTNAIEIYIGESEQIPLEVLERINVNFLSRYRLRPKQPFIPEYPGFFYGDASDFQDLLVFWNLRANFIPLIFLDKRYESRYSGIVPKIVEDFKVSVKKNTPRRMEWCRVWRRQEVYDPTSRDVPKIFSGASFGYRDVDKEIWSDIHVPPVHFIDETTVLAVVTNRQKPKISFSLTSKPFSSEGWFYRQLVVASVQVSAGSFIRDDFTLSLPYVPELNEFYARAVYYHYDRLRSERQGFGLILNATTSDISLSPLPTTELFQKIFEVGGFKASVSSGGLIARQLIAQLGGLQGGRVFKIPGARRLLKTYGPQASFTKRAGLRLIGSKDPENPDANFADHQDLRLEFPAEKVKLDPENVFLYLIKTRLFRIGADIKCPTCQLTNWYGIDDLRQRLTCHMCGDEIDATTQLVTGESTYRRSGVLGAERNAQGAVPVVLTLQQLDATIKGFFGTRAYSVSLDLKPLAQTKGKNCEVDFAWLLPPIGNKNVLIIGECKDSGFSPARDMDGGTINSSDIENLRAVADSFPKERFEVYILLAKLCPFTPTEVELARTLNGDYDERVILLTERELEPYFIFERTAKIFPVQRHAVSADDLARATGIIYFNKPGLSKLQH